MIFKPVDMKNKISVKSQIKGTSTNAEGYTLFILVNEFIKKSDIVHVSFKNTNSLSSSFLNSSLGALCEEYGIRKVLRLVKITDCNSIQIVSLKRYFDHMKSILK